MKKFYSAAEKRNEVMLKNLLDGEKNNIKAIVYGGYHSDGIKEYLKAKGISYEEILPSVDGKQKANNYEKRFMEQAKYLMKKGELKITDKEWVEKLEAGQKSNGKLQLMSVLANRGIEVTENGVRKYIEFENMGVKRVAKIFLSRPRSEISEPEFFGLLVTAAKFYGKETREILQQSEVGREIIAVLELGKKSGEENAGEVQNALRVYEDARQELEVRRGELDDGEEGEISESIDQEESTETSLMQARAAAATAVMMTAMTMSQFFASAAIAVIALAAVPAAERENGNSVARGFQSIVALSSRAINPIESLSSLFGNKEHIESIVRSSIPISSTIIDNVSLNLLATVQEIALEITEIEHRIITDQPYIAAHQYDVRGKKEGTKIIYTPAMLIFLNELDINDKIKTMTAVSRHEVFELQCIKMETKIRIKAL